RGLVVLFDPNFRPALPDTPEAALERQREVLPYVDWYLAGEEEVRLLWGDERLPCATVLRRGEAGAVVGGELVPPPRLAEVLDEIGAGDGFAAGFAFGLLRGLPPREACRIGHVVAAGALAGTGDWETFPRLEELDPFLHVPSGHVR